MATTPIVVQQGAVTLGGFGVETQLGAKITVPGRYQVVADVSSLDLGDQLELIVYLTFPGMPERVAFRSVDLVNKQQQELAFAPSFDSPVAFRATLIQLFGTLRTIPWVILAS